MGKRIAPASPLDLLSLVMPPAAVLHLDLAQHLLSPHRPLLSMVSSWLGLGERTCTLTCWQGRDLLACVQARHGRTQTVGEVCYLAAWPSAGSSAEGLWEELLLGLGVEAGQQGAQRLLARLPSEEHLEMFQRAGFTPFAEEMLLVQDGPAEAVAQEMPELRLAQPEDLQAIQQLHAAITPPIVQQAEGGGGDSWSLRHGEEGWVWPVTDGVRAYLRRRHGARGACLDLLLAPSSRQHAAAVLAHGLVGLTSPAYLVLRSYQGELLEVARRLGFRLYAEQVLLARHLTVVQEERQGIPARKTDRHVPAPSTPSVGRAC